MNNYKLTYSSKDEAVKDLYKKGINESNSQIGWAGFSVITPAEFNFDGSIKKAPKYSKEFIVDICTELPINKI